MTISIKNVLMMTKAIARAKARQVVEEEEKKRSNRWTFYQDFGWKTALHTNIGNVSSSKTQLLWEPGSNDIC